MIDDAATTSLTVPAQLSPLRRLTGALERVPLNLKHFVMRELVPRIHVFASGQDVDGRDVREAALRALARP